MPIYEYRCNDCRRRVSIFWRSFSEITEPRCPHCGGRHLTRLVSRVATLRSEESRLESLADSSVLTDLDENDPRSLARFMKHMSAEMGEDLGDEFNEVVERLEAGQSPEEIESEMPGLGGEPAPEF
ncbi:MAG: zinc ribbon domain-containing protein [Chloroflexi bacterium]|nr:zinc ribbon domain-containing protein [Chloroflexota bacterium]